MNLITTLKEKQGQMSQVEFAAVLGISPAMLSRIYSGERVVGESIGRRISKVYPDLLWLVTGYLMTKDELTDDKAS